MPDGQIVKALSGYYYVLENHSTTVWQCRARGIFKKRGIQPLVGDAVQFKGSVTEEGTITHIYERKNELMRPPIANVDQALIVFSFKEPALNTALLDKFLVHIEQAHIMPVICFTKVDLYTETNEDLVDMKTYENIGYPVCMTSVLTGQGMADIQKCLQNKITVFAGQSGVGKTSLLNKMDPSFRLETGSVSTRIGRGRHTTRHVELLLLPQGGMVADTPGFSQLDFVGIEPEELGQYFIEFTQYVHQCKYRGCLHENEPQCAVKKATEAGEITAHRYQHYLQFLKDVKEQKQRKRY